MVPWVRIPPLPPVGKRSVWLARYAGSPPDFERKIEFFVFVPRSGTPEAGFSKLKPMKYFIYTRKSTDSEERQILSIESQLAELREFATKEKLEIVASLCEAQTAKEPGRKVFGENLSPRFFGSLRLAKRGDDFKFFFDGKFF